jgi:hypothetical protein
MKYWARSTIFQYREELPSPFVLSKCAKSPARLLAQQLLLMNSLSCFAKLNNYIFCIQTGKQVKIMKKPILLLLLLTTLLAVVACNSEEENVNDLQQDGISLLEGEEVESGDLPTSEEDNIQPLEWGNITSFTMIMTSFDGHEEFQIVKRDGQYLFNAIGLNGVEFFVPRDQPIDVSEVEVIRNILETNNLDSWNGFDYQCELTEDGWWFLLEFTLDTGSTFRMSGLHEVPVELEETFQALEEVFNDLANHYVSE